MNLFEAKNILKNNGFKLIKEATGEVKVVLTFGIERTSAARCNPNNSAERRDYHILMSQIKKIENNDQQDSKLKQIADPNKLGGARMNNQRVKTNYKTSYIWINPDELNEQLAEFNLRAKVEYSQVDTETSEGDENPYYEYGVVHLFPHEMVGESCPYCYITYFRDYKITLLGTEEDMMSYFNVDTLDEINEYAEDIIQEWTSEYTVPCDKTGCDKHPKVSKKSVKVQIIDSTDDDDIETEEEEVKRIVP